MFRRWFSIFIASVLISGWLIPGDVEAARGKKKGSRGGGGGGNIQSYYEETLAMPDGLDKTLRLEEIIQEDARRKLGPEPVEILLRLYLDSGELDKVAEMMPALIKRRSSDYELKSMMAKSLYEERNDLRGARDLLDQAVKEVPIARRKVPEGIFAGAWYSETQRIMGQLNYQAAQMLLEEDEIEKAKEYVARAMSYRNNPVDLFLFSEILLREGQFRESMGSSMLAIHRGGIGEAKETFKSAYDSLEWDIRQFEEYFDSFGELYLEENVKMVLKAKYSQTVRDLPGFAVSEILGENGAILVFWDENILDADFKAMQELKQMLKEKHIPYKFIYSGNDYSNAMKILHTNNYTFAGTEIASFEVLKEYNITYPPTILLVGTNSRIVYRMEGPNRSWMKVVEKVWEDYTTPESVMTDQK
ncbi:MAG: hypothetical protein P9L92_17160 [Candidatus Electryonea clarkiae]|nr:hypothetical protein [Candidatus Electryonea clarkiae]MDP8285637.1 hypothetical protein [Candidatus Electryonea clarkiae]